jgi:hypothetical protein
MALEQMEFDAVIKLTLSKPGKKQFSLEDIALAMLEAENEINNMKLVPYNGANKYIRLHVGEPKERKETNGSNQD